MGKFLESLFLQPSTMTSAIQVLKLNLLPPEKLYCDFNYWSSLFTQDMQVIWDKGHCVPLKKLPPEVSDMIFPYLLLALSDYKTLNKKNLLGSSVLTYIGAYLSSTLALANIGILTKYSKKIINACFK